MRNHFVAGDVAWDRSLLLWRPGPARNTHFEVRGFLGSLFPNSRPIRRIHHPRIYAVHTDARNGILACGAITFCTVWRDSPGKSRRGLGGSAGRRMYRPVFLPDPAAHRYPLVRRGIARSVGLGGELFVLCTRQWSSGPGAPAAFVFPRRTLAN